MFAKSLTIALASSALFATIAVAQTPTATSDRATMDTISSSTLQGDWRASKIVGLSVYNDRNEKLGAINDLIMDKSGNVKAAVLGVGGFLGMGAYLVAVPLDKIKFSTEAIAYTGAANAPNAPMNSPMTARPPTTTGSATGTTTTSAKADPWSPDHAVFNATKEELKAMPEFKYSTQ